MRPSGLTAKVIVALGLLLVPPAADAQPAGKVYRVVYLSTGEMRPELAHHLEVLRAGLRDHGYVEGRNLAFEFRSAEGKPDRLPGLAAELVALPVDVIVAGSSQAIRTAKAASRTTPIVFVGSADPVTAGFVASFARPGGNLTGLTWDAGPELGGKWLELAKEAMPGMSRVSVLWDADPANPRATALAYWAAMESAARQLKLALHIVTVRQSDDLVGAFAAIERARPDALVWCFSGLGDRPVLDFAARRRLPAVGCWREPVALGALMSYHPSVPDLFRRAAVYIDKILKGARPADLPVEQPTKFELVINMKTAKALGLTIPPSLRLRADELIE
ncbi:MAG: ABC transporter substrate-binding protein [Candidatus Rokubacteria bacterium]|nr:ABC transporter substrate-binding protein [Candidatus Rokubacteria bacterium]